MAMPEPPAELRQVPWPPEISVPEKMTHVFMRVLPSYAAQLRLAQSFAQVLARSKKKMCSVCIFVQK
jgi:hypothetical protein